MTSQPITQTYSRGVWFFNSIHSWGETESDLRYHACEESRMMFFVGCGKMPGKDSQFAVFCYSVGETNRFWNFSWESWQLKAAQYHIGVTVWSSKYMCRLKLPLQFQPFAATQNLKQLYYAYDEQTSRLKVTTVPYSYSGIAGRPKINPFWNLFRRLRKASSTMMHP